MNALATLAIPSAAAYYGLRAAMPWMSQVQLSIVALVIGLAVAIAYTLRPTGMHYGKPRIGAAVAVQLSDADVAARALAEEVERLADRFEAQLKASASTEHPEGFIPDAMRQAMWPLAQRAYDTGRGGAVNGGSKLALRNAKDRVLEYALRDYFDVRLFMDPSPADLKRMYGTTGVCGGNCGGATVSMLNVVLDEGVTDPATGTDRTLLRGKCVRCGTHVRVFV
jgi:hypothetical protein